MTATMEILKSLYEMFGVPHPMLSLVAVSILGAVLFGGGWAFTGSLVEKDRAKARMEVVQPVGGSSAAGQGNVAISGDGNTVNYNAPALTEPSQPQKANKR